MLQKIDAVVLQVLTEICIPKFNLPMDKIMLPVPTNHSLFFFPSISTLSEVQNVSILEELGKFTSNWKKHGQAVQASYGILLNRFVWVSVDQSSGCSIDSLYRTISSLEQTLGITLQDRSYVHFYTNNLVLSVEFTKLKEAYLRGEIDANTTTINLLVNSAQNFEKDFMKPLQETPFYKLVSN
jgi:hypothetical protein